MRKLTLFVLLFASCSWRVGLPQMGIIEGLKPAPVFVPQPAPPLPQPVQVSELDRLIAHAKTDADRDEILAGLGYAHLAQKRSAARWAATFPKKRLALTTKSHPRLFKE